MAQAKSISFDNNSKRLNSAVDIFRALVKFRRGLYPGDNEPPLPDNILEHLPFYLDVHVEDRRGVIRFVKDNGTISYQAEWLLRQPRLRAS